MGPNSTFSMAVRQGKSAYSWNTTPRSAPACVTSWPSTKMWPVVGSTKPAIMLSRVDLPQPEGPRRQVKLFSGSSRLTSSRARVPST
jgi:hypothetical protein